MTAFSVNNLAAACRVLGTAALLLCGFAVPAFASTEIMARPQGVDDNQALNVGEDAPAADDPAAKSDNADARDQGNAGTLTQDFNVIEPLGLLDESEGGFGEDVWLGTDRDRAVSLMAQAPSITYYPVAQDMLRRLYLTRAKPDYFAHNHAPDPGADYLTLRLERLNDMGLFEYSTKLYSLITDVPYHERLARAGVLAMMEGGKSSLGCLETRTVLDRFGQMEFWQTLNGICDLKETGPRRSRQALEGNDIDLAASDSPVIARIASDRSFVERPASQQDIDRLTPLERAALQASGSLSFSRFRFNPDQTVSPVAFGMVIGNTGVDETRKFTAVVQSAAFGLRPTSDIQDRYDLVKNDTTHAPTGWRILASTYAKAGLTDPGAGQTALIEQAMIAGQRFGGVYALTPYAGMIAAANPDSFSTARIADAVRIMIAANVAVPQKWLERLAGQTNDAKTLNLLLAASADSDLSTGLKAGNTQVRQLFGALPDDRKVMIAALFIRLDKSKVLHNYVSSDIYEKLMDLTAHLDYGMHDTELASDLLHAYQDKKLGESIVLTAIALRDTRPQDLDPKLAGDIVGGMWTVGLTKEARSMAAAVIMGSGY